MNLNKKMSALGLLIVLILGGCKEDTPQQATLAGINKVAIIGLTYSKDIEEESRVLTAATKPSESSVPAVAPIDSPLQEYFGEIVVELRRLIENREIEVISAEKFSGNKTLEALIASQNKSVPAAVLANVYSPKHYALALYPHEPEKLAKLVKELKVDALLTVRLAIIKKRSNGYSLGAETQRVGVQMELILIDKNGLPVFEKPMMIRAMSKERYELESPIFYPEKGYKIASANEVVLSEVKTTLFTEMQAVLSKSK